MNGSTAACNGTGPLDICEVTTNWNPDDTIACNLDRNGDGTAASAYGVWVPADTEWHFFGTDATGDDGDDALYGDLDTGAGAHGIDDLEGGAGDDLLCSGGRDTFLVGEESLFGGDGDDVLWANHHPSATGVVGDASTVDGGPAYDYCDSQAYVTTVSTCEIALTGGLFPSPTPPVTCW